MQGSRRAVHAEASLAGPHPEPQQPADVIETGAGALAQRVLQCRARNQLALADQLFVDQVGLLALQSLAQAVMAAVLGARQRLGPCRAGPLLAEPSADGIDRVLGHQAKGGELASGDGQKAADAVALGVVEQGVRAGDVAGLGA